MPKPLSDKVVRMMVLEGPQGDLSDRLKGYMYFKGQEIL